MEREDSGEEENKEEVDEEEKMKLEKEGSIGDVKMRNIFKKHKMKLLKL